MLVSSLRTTAFHPSYLDWGAADTAATPNRAVGASIPQERKRHCDAYDGVMVQVLLLFLMIPACSWAWTPTERCELAQETPTGTVAVSPTRRGILLYLPEGFVTDGTWVTVSIGSRIWRVRAVDSAVELKGGTEAFLERNWATVSTEGDQVLGFNLSGSSSAWEKLEDCERTINQGLWIALSGEITVSTGDRIIGAIRRRRPEGLLLDSSGGLADVAQRIGYAVREAQMATKVPADGECLSECAFILAAGSPRTVETGSRVGITASLITKGLGAFLSGRGSLVDSAAYFSAMDVKGGRLAVLATDGAHEDLRIFTREELSELGLANTSVPRATTPAVPGRLSKIETADWWLLGGLLLVAVLAWILAEHRSKDRRQPD
ncbi:MAG: hypothetical protein LJE70_11420 [Chromatiaceae bacterium]|jgi:hypothetical protein|nr:hypothetical protein [Chromatiaceae bacterium]